MADPRGPSSRFRAARPPDRDLVYREVPPGPELHLHLFLPSGWTPAERRAGIVFFFGGGWQGGQLEQFHPQASYLAGRGMVALCAGYRTESTHGTSPADCISDAKAALRWVRLHSGELGIDPMRIAAGGGSAGAQIAAASAILRGFDDIAGSATSCLPDALVLFNPVLDNGPGGYGHELVAAYWEAFSVLHNLRSRPPPTIAFLGTEDEFVPVATMVDFRTRAERLGGRCDLLVYEGWKHGFFNLEGYEVTVAAMEGFLRSLGYLMTEV